MVRIHEINVNSHGIGDVVIVLCFVLFLRVFFICFRCAFVNDLSAAWLIQRETYKQTHKHKNREIYMQKETQTKVHTHEKYFTL